MLVFTIASRFSKSLRDDGFTRFTSLVSLLSVSIGCIALVVSISILTGYEQLILDTATRYTSHVEVQSLDEDGIEHAPDVIARIKNVENIVTVDPIIIREVLVRSRAGIDGAAIHALPADRVVRRLSGIITDGSLANDGCFVGSQLARNLGISSGDTLTFYAANKLGEHITPVLFIKQIAGIYQTGMYDVDNSTIVMTDSMLLLAMRTLVTPNPDLLAVTIDAPERNTEEIVKGINEIVRGRAMIFSWRERFYSVSAWIELQREPIPIILALITIVAAFTLISIVLVSVIQKTKSIAILMSLGMDGKRIAITFVIQALRLSVIGSVAGSVIAYGFAWTQNTWYWIHLDGSVYYVSVLPVSLDPTPYVLVPIFSVVLALMASLAPITAITRVKPAYALRFS